MSESKDGQAGPMMKRVKIDGNEHFLPFDAKLAEPFPAEGTEAEKQAWIERELNEPLGGTW